MFSPVDRNARSPQSPIIRPSSQISRYIFFWKCVQGRFFEENEEKLLTFCETGWTLRRYSTIHTVIHIASEELLIALVEIERVYFSENYT